MTPDEWRTLLGAVLVLNLVLLVVVTWLSGRLLGIRRGFWRSLVASTIALLLGIQLLGWELGGEVPDNVGTGILLLAGTTVLVAMVLSIALDALLPRRGRSGPGRVRAGLRRARATWSSWGRVLEIARHARANGLATTSWTTPEGARALRRTLEDSGGILVKFGQIASTRADLLPPAVVAELSHLRGDVPALPAEVVTRTVEAELGAPIDQLFASFDREALAAASIGVTHRAVLPDGRRVIVKIQRPGIEQTVDRDARVLRWGARRLEGRRAEFASLQVGALADELVASVRRELDFTAEQASNAAMRATRAADPGMRFPEILPELTTRRVLVMEEVAGRPASDQAALSQVARPRAEIADNLLGSFLAQTLVDGLFHADPHPGNVLVDAAGDVWLIDYGAVGVVDPITLEGLQQLAGGFLQRDPSVMARAVRRMVGTQGTKLDIVAIETDMAAVVGQFGGGAGFDPAILAAVARSLARYDVPAPRALTVLARAGLTLDGTLDEIEPGFAMGQRALPHLRQIALDQVGTSPRDVLMREAMRSLPSLRVLPQLTEDLALQARAGSLSLSLERLSGADGRVVDEWVDRVLFVAIGLGGLLGSSGLVLAGVLAEGSEVQRYLYGLGFAGLVVSGAALLRAVAQLQQRGRSR